MSMLKYDPVGMSSRSLASITRLPQPHRLDHLFSSIVTSPSAWTELNAARPRLYSHPLARKTEYTPLRSARQFANMETKS